MARQLAFVLVTLLTLLIPRTALPQALTGTVTGTVPDGQGSRLAHAPARISSPSLIGGQLPATTNATGQLRFQALPLYVLETEAPGFSRYGEEGIPIGAGATVERSC